MNSNLYKQFKKLIKNNFHNDAFLTRRTYEQRFGHFLEFCSNRKIQKISNIKNKAVQDYISYQLENGCSESTLVTTMSAIRYFCDMNAEINKTENHVTIDNRMLGIGKMKHTYKDGITEEEYADALRLANGDKVIYYGIKLGYILGLRSNEIFNLRLDELSDCIKSDECSIIISHGTKGGRKRVSEFLPQHKQELIEIYEWAKSNGKHYYDKVLCSNEKDACKKLLSQWHNWWSRKSTIIAKDTNRTSETRLSAHALRRQYSRNMYEYYKKQNISGEIAAEKVSEDLGHGRSRKDITAIYLGFA